MPDDAYGEYRLSRCILSKDKGMQSDSYDVY